MKKIILSVVVLLMAATSFAQTKVGTIDADFILAKMPELTTVQNALKEYNLDLEKQLKVKLDAYDLTLSTANEKVATMSDADKAAKQEELAGLENEIEKFRQNGTQLVQLKQNELVQPLYKKIGDALNEIAKAQGYSQVITVGNNNTIAYLDPAYDLTTTVMQKLGIPVN
ncbi:MAG: outer membrane protein [Dokdonia sp.]|jgi:outer membrane protein